MPILDHTAKFAKTALLLSASIFMAGHAAAQQVPGQPQAAPQPVRNGIEVLVNDLPITTHDIRQRIQLTLARSGGVQSEEQFIKLREQVIESMIDETLKKQTAAEFELVIGQDEIDSFFAREARNYNQTPEQFEQILAQIGSSKRSLVDQLSAEFAWAQIIQGRFGPSVTVSDGEVEDFMARKQAQKGEEEYRLAEIVIRVSNPAQEAQVKVTANRILEQIRGGGNFRTLAQQLSQSPSSANGGDIGWTTANDLDPELLEALEQRAMGEVLDPIRTAGGYRIVAFIDRRKILEADPLDETLLMTQLFLPQAVINIEPATEIAFREETERLQGTSTACESVQGIADKLGLEATTSLNPVTLKVLPPELRTTVVDLEIGQTTTLLEEDSGLRVFILCDRKPPVAPTLEFDRILSTIENTRLEMMGRRYLRDLRREAIIDYKQ